MKYRFIHFTMATIMFGLLACHSGGSNKDNDQNTPARTTTDTTMLPGSPGPSGTQPRASDTTQAHRDSLKHVVSLPDSGKNSGN